MLLRQQHSAAGIFSPGSVWSHLLLLFLLALLAGVVQANTEKTIFLGPPISDASSLDASSSSLNGLWWLHRLSPENLTTASWRTRLPSSFPWADDAASRSTTWIRLESLTPGQRYELRVCWAATQPTEFDLETFSVGAVLETPALAESLAAFVDKHGMGKEPSAESSAEFSKESRNDALPALSSVLLLRIVAYADYVARNRSLMHPDRVPPVLTDVILDPYLGNVLPRSLVSTVGCIVAVAAVSAMLAPRIARQLRALAGPSVDIAAGEKKKNQ